MPADLFAPVERVVAKYRRDVHQLAAPASAEAISSLEGHLKRVLPEDMRTFLAKYNGGSLFRGALRLRTTSDITPASETAPQVVLYADAQGDRRWAWAADGNGGHVFGVWNGQELEGLYASYSAWLASEVSLLDTQVSRPEDQDALRLESDPNDVYQLVRIGEGSLRSGQPEQAERLLRKATQIAPHHVLAWQRLGDALAITDRSAARTAWQQAFRCVRFPLLWPGAPCFDPDIVRALSAAFPDRTQYERDLEKFLADQVRDVISAVEAQAVLVVATELAKSRVRRGKRSEARAGLSEFVERAKLFSWRELPWHAVLDLARLEFDLGNHDQAEEQLRRLRRAGPRDLQALGLLALGRIAVTRQEPWAEEILDEALAGNLDEDDRVEACALRVERAVRQEKGEEAKRWLEEAHRLAQRVAVRSLQAQVQLAEADVARLAGDQPRAKESLRKGLALLAEREDHELRARLTLRLGDVAYEEGKQEDAFRLYQQAVETFHAHELPVREGWALLRLARVVREPTPLLTAARDRFLHAELGAGIAALDAHLGNPGASLPWHLARASDQARSRHDAQRSRPPWDRSDADKPERRLGAHRLAIAACSEAIVATIERELDACARAMASGRGRALDPPVMGYIAAVDLLSAHRSYAAAQVLLRHLLRGTVEGTAWRALQGALSRSPNAALVDGLLSCVESPASHPADAVAAAAEVLGLRRERASVLALMHLASPRSNPLSRKAAIVALGRIGDRSAVEKIWPALDDQALAEHAALALLMLGDRQGVDFHGRALSEDRRDLTGSPGEIVGRYGGPNYLLLLVRTAEGSDDRALGALQGLGLLGDPRAVPTLLKATTSRERRVVEVAGAALTILTGHNEDMEESSAKHQWAAWWEEHGGRFHDGVRHRDGKVFDSGILISKMDHSDPWVRRTSYDELVITSGASLPFDSDGPWRLQRSHLRAWHEWWTKSKGRISPGHWHLDGKLIS